MNRKLAICIPSYQRAPLLSRTLEAFLPEVMPHRVPIYVSWEDPTDQTLKRLSELKERYPLIFFRTDAAKQGIDRNIATAVSMASSRYVWLFGDDDLPRPGAVEAVLRRLDAGFSLVVVNAASFNSDFSRCIEERRMRVAADRLYLPGEHESLLADTAAYATFLGGVVIDRSLWLGVEQREFLGSDYLHVAVAYRCAVGRGALLLAEPLVDMRLGGAVWAKRYFEVELVNWPRVVWGLPGEHYSDAAKRAVCAAKPTGSIARLLATRAYGSYRPEEYARFIEPDRDIPIWKKPLLRAVARFPAAWARRGLLGFRRLQALRGRGNLELTRYRLTSGAA